MNNFPLLERLNQEQRAAVTADDGYLCIDAAAGTGKTSTVAARILYLQLVRNVPPESIMVVSFSRAARGNLLERLKEFVNLLGRGSNVTVLTLHGLAFRTLRLAIQNRETWLRPGFAVVSGSRGRLNPLFEEYGDQLVGGLKDPYPFETRLVLYSKALDMLRQGHPELSAAVICPEELPDHSIVIPWENGTPLVDLASVRRVWIRYNKLLRQKNCIDYAGMLSECIKVLYEEGETLRRMQSGLRYLIVDEYQDTSRAQEEIIQLLAGDQASINVVGDSDQAIYTFNGSDLNNILQFNERMAGRTLPVLPSISLLQNYRSTPCILNAANRILEKASLTQSKRLVPAASGVSETVGSYRKRNLPATQVHTLNLKEAAEWVAGEIQRLIQEEGVQPSEIAVLVRKDTNHAPQGRLVREALRNLGLATQVQDRDPQRTAQMLDVVYSFLNEQIGESLSELIERVKAHDCDAHFLGVTNEEVVSLLEEAREAGATDAIEAADMVYDMGSPEQSAPDITGVQIRTIHSAKGLEFRVVFLLYVADGDFPSGAHPDVGEEWRLYYVGVTRAMERLYIVGKHSRFFDAVSGDGVQLIDTTKVEAVVTTISVGIINDDKKSQIQAARQRQREQEAARQRNRF